VTYQVDTAAAPVGVTASQPAQPTHAAGRGTLVDLRSWLDSVDPASLEPSLHTRRATTAILTTTAPVLQSLTADLDVQAWKHEPTPDDWSILEIVCHLRDTEREVHKLQLAALREEPQPFVPRPEAAVWAAQRNYQDEDGPAALAGLRAARLDTLREVTGVSAETWDKPARHAIFGPTHFGEVVGFMADHDRLHIQQAWETLHAPG
jgi:hypothetical protein